MSSLYAATSSCRVGMHCFWWGCFGYSKIAPIIFQANPGLFQKEVILTSTSTKFLHHNFQTMLTLSPLTAQKNTNFIILIT